MKKNITLLFIFIATVSLYAQSPEKMSYQAVLRDVTNTLIVNQTVGMQISILQGSPTGTAVYVETQSPTSNDNGLVTLEIGTGSVVSGTFNTINWGSGTYYIKTESDPTGGNTYTITGTSQLLSVPYALHAKNAENTLKYLGAARAKNQSSANPNVNNEIANGASTKVRWLDVSENYGNSIGGTNNTDITVPAGVQFIRIHCVIIYDQNLIATDNKSTLYVSKNGNPFNGLTNSGYGTWHFFNSFYGLTFYSQLIPVTPGEVFDITLSQNSGASLYLSWGSISSSVSFEFYGY